MTSFGITFSHPWLLLLLIPALALTLIPYFRLSKKYRRTRNRITSMVLHLLVMFLSITILAGMMFTYSVPHRQNEIIFLVDVSATEENSKEDREQFIQKALRESQYDNYNVGVVTFGFDQNYAVPLTNDVDSVYDAYLNAALPDTSATNIAAALSYTAGRFTHPESSKIVLITDGKETDERALEVIRSVVAQGTKVDIAYVGAPYSGEDIQLTGIKVPDYHVMLNEKCEITLNLSSNSDMENVTVNMYDNGVLNEESSGQNFSLKSGENSLVFAHEFSLEGLHEISFSVSVDGEPLTENNHYVTYMNLEVFNKILILESGNESEALVKMLNGEAEEANETYKIDVVDIASENVPGNINELCEYHQVILNDISNSALVAVKTDDEEISFVQLLETYVSEYGGGMFTVGGDKAYDREELRGSLYQSMLPVQAMEYSPPVGVVVLVDRSGSMSGEKIEWARAAISACLEQMNDRDYIGIVTLDDYDEVILGLTPVTQEAKIKERILALETASGGTIFSNAIDTAGGLLLDMKGTIDKMHIVMITDGGVSGNDPYERYMGLIKSYYSQGVTLSMIGVGMSTSVQTAMKELTDAGGGGLYAVADVGEIVDKMKEDLKETTIGSVNDYEVTPTVFDILSPLVQNLELGEGDDWNKFNVTLGGFYGGKVRSTAELVLVGEYNVPLYAQWKYGKGIVGSFMSDLQASDWSQDFMEDADGIQFIRNVVNNLMPVEDIQPQEIVLQSFVEDNYTNHLSIDGKLQDGEYLTARLVPLSDSATEGISLNEVTQNVNADSKYYVTVGLNAENKYTRCSFIVKAKGVYQIEIFKYDAQGTLLTSLVEYKTFSYSEEYDVTVEEDEAILKEELNNLASKGNGSLIEDLSDTSSIFEDFVTAIEKSFDPRFLFMILAIVLFLADIAVRKFKFKWINEIVRAYKEKHSK